MDDWSTVVARRMGATALLLASCLCLAGCIGSSSAQTTAAGKQAYERAIQRLLGQRRFQISEVLHYGGPSQPERYHLRVRFIAPNRLEQEQDDHPGITISVGRVTCTGPRRWHCRHVSFPRLMQAVSQLLLPTSQPQTPLRDVTFTVAEVGKSRQITVHAHGDLWTCPPFAVTCGGAQNPEPRLLREQYTAQLTLDRRTGLPVSWTSWVTIPHLGRSDRQRIVFNYAQAFSIQLPHYAAWSCPSWDPPATWCMKEPGA